MVETIRVYSVQICMQIRLKMEAGACQSLNMNAMKNDLLSQSLIESEFCKFFPVGTSTFQAK